MNDLFIKIVGFNLALSVFYLVYLLIYRKDKAFLNRRFYLLFTIVLSIILPFIPMAWSTGDSSPLVIRVDLEELLITSPGVKSGPFVFTLSEILFFLYLLISSAIAVRLLILLFKVVRTIYSAKRISLDGQKILLSKELHGSSFFRWIFLDPDSCSPEESKHILKHELAHVRQVHSADRIIIELLLVVNWFNPLLWMLKSSLIENHEYLADSAVINEGTNTFNYQLSILNQYIGCASINNQFSSQIKKRIKMLNLTQYKNGNWKLVFLVPVSLMFLFLFSFVGNSQAQENKQSTEKAATGGEVFYVVEEMPTFNGKDAGQFRYYIAENLEYPADAVKAGAQGKIMVNFVVTTDGSVRLAGEKETYDQDGNHTEAVIYKPLKDSPAADQKMIELLKKEAVRVVLSSSGQWQAGIQRGTKVDVLFTFPINFALK